MAALAQALDVGEGELTTAVHILDGNPIVLPLDLVTESNAVLGKKGSGKTSAGVVLYEEMFAAGVPVVAVDPKGDWYGIRSSADGKHEGLPVPVFGGRHGDIPLESSAGVFIADLILDRHLSCVLDVSEFSKADLRRFMIAFADRLYRAADRDPLHLFLEECHEYIPQVVSGEDAKMVGAWEKLVKQGRFKGIGVTLLSQRAASVNKNVLTQIDNLFVMRTISAQDRQAVKGWIEYQADSADILSTLAGLQTGECWLYQPSRGVPVKFRFRMRHTFDAGATPKVGEKPVQPSTLADVDLSAIREAMAETIEKAKSDDPKELRRLLAQREADIAGLSRQLDEVKQLWETVPVPDPVEVLVPVLDSQDHAFLAGIVERLDEIMQRYPDELSKSIAPFVKAAPARAVAHPIPRTVPVTRPQADPVDGLKLGKAHRAILTVLAQRGTSTRNNIATLAGYSYTSGGFNNTISQMKTAGYLVGDNKTAWTITEDGLNALGDFDQLPTGRALVDYWLGKFGKAERAILASLVEAWPNTLTRDEIADLNDYSATSGGFNNSISKLRALDLISGTKDALIASDLLGEAKTR